QPRVSFNYSFDTERLTQLRGGVGIFASDVPTVWYSNSFGGTGITQVTYDIIDSSRSPVGTLLCSNDGRTFTKATGAACGANQVSYVKQSPVYKGPPLVPSTGTLVPGDFLHAGPSMSVDTVDPNFQMPSTTQFVLGFDRELPWWGIIGTAEFNFTQTNDDIFYKTLNIGKVTYTGPDGRNYYCDPTKIATCSGSTRFLANPSFGTVTELTNTHQ